MRTQSTQAFELVAAQLTKFIPRLWSKEALFNKAHFASWTGSTSSQQSLIIHRVPFTSLIHRQEALLSENRLMAIDNSPYELLDAGRVRAVQIVVYLDRAFLACISCNRTNYCLNANTATSCTCSTTNHSLRSGLSCFPNSNTVLSLETRTERHGQRVSEFKGLKQG